MSFPDFDNEPQTNDEIQVEHLTSHDNQEDDFNFNVNVNQATNENFFHGQGQSNFTMEQNIPYGQIEVDEEEEARISARKNEEQERRSKIITLMNEEIRVKQEYRDKAREYLDNFAEIRLKTVNKRQEFNKQNEIDFLQNRQAMKEGKKNPWERVVENIEIKESDYKGTKDVSRMRSVILVRKGDMMKMK